MANETAEQAILNKLAQAPSFHPAGAKLFVPDWTLDPGDVVTVTAKDNVNDPDETPTAYNVPIYSLNLTWNGASRVEIESTGNQQREPLSALRRKEYQTGRRGYGRQQELENEFKEFETWQEQTDEVIGTYAAQFVDILGDGTNEGRLTLAETAIEQTASDATITAQAAGILLDVDGHPILDARGKYQYDPNAADTTLIAQINTNAAEILAKVSQSDLNTTLASYLQINAFSTELASTLDNGDTTLAAKIITAVNKNTNTSSVVISADQINLDGVVNSTEMDTRLLNADALFSNTGYIGTITASGVHAGGNVVADGSVIGSGLYIGTAAPYTDVSTAVSVIRKKTSGLADGEIGFEYHTLGSSTWVPVNFNIADTAYYKSHVGISTVAAAGWTNDGEGGGYYNIVTATAKDSTQQNPDTMDVNVVLPTITVRPDLGTNASGTVKAYGPVVDGYDYQVSTAATIYLKADENYCYITSNNNTPTASNIVAQIANPGGGGGGGSYYATFLDNITLESTDIGDSVTKYSVANYSDGHRDSAANTRVVIDASAVYSAGVTAGLGGVVDVVKQPWNGNTCEFTPSAGEGASASVTITEVPTKVLLANATSTAEVVIKDGNNTVQTKNYYLRSRTYDGQNYIVLTDSSSVVSLGTVLAKYSASGGGSGTRAVERISSVKLTSSDIGSSVTKYPTLFYDDSTDDNTIPLYIDASAVYQRGQQDGSGLTILDQYSTTIDSNNTTVTLLPSDKGNYNVMASANVRIQVPVHEGVQGATLLASTDSDSAWSGWQLNDYTTLDKKYGFIRIAGNDGSTYSYGIDANGVFDAGVSAGAGVQIETSKSYGSTVTETGTYTINPSSGYDAMRRATFSVRVPTVPRIQSTLAYGTASIGSHTVYPDEDYDAMQRVTFTVPNVTVETQRNQPTTGVTTTNIKVGNNIKVIVKFGNAIVNQQIFAATT